MGSCFSKVNKDKEAEPPRPAPKPEKKPIILELPKNHFDKPQADGAWIGEAKAEVRRKLKDGPSDLHSIQCTMAGFPDTRYHISNMPHRREHSEIDSIYQPWGTRERHHGKLGWSEF